jgi:hypothetical protein
MGVAEETETGRPSGVREVPVVETFRDIIGVEGFGGNTVVETLPEVGGTPDGTLAELLPETGGSPGLMDTAVVEVLPVAGGGPGLSGGTVPWLVRRLTKVLDTGLTMELEVELAAM